MKVFTKHHGVINVKTHYVCPPIPVRGVDWAAWNDDWGADDSPVGRGATELEAIDDLLELLEAEADFDDTN